MEKQTCVLLTGAGGTALPFLIKLLQSKGYRVLAADMDSQAVGLYLADKGFVIPAGDSDDFLPVIRNICHQESVNVFIPLVDEELERSIDLEQEGTSVILPQKNFIKTCLDKYMLSKAFESFDIPQPKTYLLSEFENQIKFPFIIKPRVGRGSRGVSVINSTNQFEEYKKHTSNCAEQLIIQEYIDGSEYTVSVVVWRDGFVQAVVPKEIISKKGVTKMAVTRGNKKIDEVCRVIQKNMHADGPFNVQLKLDSIGNPKVFEINPRFSTSITLTIASGVDEMNLLIESSLSKDKNIKICEWREGIVLVRQSVDTFFSDQEFDIKKNNIKQCVL